MRRSKYLPDGGNLTDYDFNPIIRELAECIRFAKEVGEIKRDEEANHLWREIYQPLSDGHSGLLGSITSRATAQTLRLAMIYALLDCSNVIRPKHLQTALALWQYCEDSAKYIFGLSLGNKLADEIFEALQKSPNGMTRSDLSHHFQRNRTSAEIKIALELLLEVGRIESYKEKTSKRPRENFFVTRYEKNEFNEFNQEESLIKELNSLNSLNSSRQAENNSDEAEYF